MTPPTLPACFSSVQLSFIRRLEATNQHRLISQSFSLSLSSPSRHPEDWLLIWSASPEIQRPNNNLCCASFLSLQVLFVCFLSFFVRFQSDSSSSFLIHFTADRGQKLSIPPLFSSICLNLVFFPSPILPLLTFLHSSALSFIILP